MKNAGVKFEIPNVYGQQIVDILEPVILNEFNWHVSMDEILVKGGNSIGDETLFPQGADFFPGDEFEHIIKGCEYYVIFASLKAFFKESKPTEIRDVIEFMEGSCQIIVSIIDSGFVLIMCKDELLLQELYNNAVKKGYSDIKFLTEEYLVNKNISFI